jgi:alpha-D-xyloside xylohydrolase
MRISRRAFAAFTGSSLVAVASAAHAKGLSALDANGHVIRLPAPDTPGFHYQRLSDGVQFYLNGVTKTVLFYGPATVRVNAHLGKNHWANKSIVILGHPKSVAFQIEDGKTTLRIKSAALSIDIDKTSGALSFLSAGGRLYTRERATSPQAIRPVTLQDAPSYEVENSFTLKPGEGIYGFGYVNEATLNRRGQNLLLVQTNTGIIIPVMVSSEGYGILWDTYSKMRFSDGADGATLWAESAPGGVDYYFMGGGSADKVIAAYRTLTGTAPMYPKQAFGLFMSKERYKTQQRLVEVAETFRKEGFPLDYIVQDWQYWGSDKDGTWSGMIWDKERFPDPDGMIRKIHDLHLKLMISIWPSVGNDTALAKELDSYGLRFKPLHWISKKARIYDAFSAKGRQIYFKHIKHGLLDKGVDALWMDGTEVEVGTACWDAAEVEADIKGLGVNAMGDFTRYLNPYTLMTTQGTYDGQRATGNKRVLTLTRSAWAGAQRTAATSWSGDIFASWKTFAEQISGGLNVTITGNPYWTQDTGGFFVTTFPGGEKNPAYRELFARWFQFAVFNPLMRVHGTSIEREPYIFKTLDPTVYAALLEAVHLRYRLLPYIYSLSWQVTASHYTLMRALPMDFPHDPKVYDINDTFMFGPACLVQPVTRAMYNLQDPPATTIPASALRTPDGRPGLAGQYFEGENFETPKGKVIDARLDHTWPGPPLAEAPGGLSGLNSFSARWEGQIIAPEDGTFELGLEGDDGYRLFIDGKLLVEDWANGAARYNGTKLTLKQGQAVAVRIEYYQATGGRSLRLAWRTPADLRAIAENRKVTDLNTRTYLPASTGWFDFWSGEKVAGGQSVTRETPLNVFPFYIREGSILPLGPVMQYATEQPDAPYEVRIYAGADATFTLYEDDNETYDYEKGAYSTYALNWSQATQSLTIGARKGRFPGMVQKRELRLVLIDGHNPPRTRSHLYDGQKAVLSFKG